MSGNQTKALCIKLESGAFGICALNIECGITTLQEQAGGKNLWVGHISSSSADSGKTSESAVGTESFQSFHSLICMTKWD